jgi:hypothetical protein
MKMPKFEITILKTTTETGYTEIEADTENEASKEVLAKLDAGELNLEWQPEDTSYSVEEIEEEDEGEEIDEDEDEGEEGEGEEV